MVLVSALREALAERLAALTAGERSSLVDSARQQSRWVELEAHAAKHGQGRTAEQYRAWAQAIKNRPSTQVYAMIHVVHGTEAVAFIDPRERSLVWFDLSRERNLSCFLLDETVEAFLAGKGNLYWRLPDAEVT